MYRDRTVTDRGEELCIALHSPDNFIDLLPVALRFPAMVQILGVDYGTTRVGLAVSSPEGTYALPLQTLTVPARARAAAVAECARKRDIQLIVVGRPIRSAGEDSAMWPIIAKFAESLRRRGFEVEFEDEAYSTAEAESLLRDAGTPSSRNRGSADAVAAKLIVESYLRRRHASE